jgi:hypothetical protein
MKGDTMSSIENVNEKIKGLIETLVEEFERTGWRAPTNERKAQIINQITKLRASMESESKKK